MPITGLGLAVVVGNGTLPPSDDPDNIDANC